MAERHQFRAHFLGNWAKSGVIRHDGPRTMIMSATPGLIRLDEIPKLRWNGPQMKVTLERAALLKTLGHVHRVVERRNTIPILSNVLLKASDRSSF